ncbi:MAG: protein kinase [Chitinispirillales bacterium]|nr:protein kinase [Chitinispirillales bacterium]
MNIPPPPPPTPPTPMQPGPPPRRGQSGAPSGAQPGQPGAKGGFKIRNVLNTVNRTILQAGAVLGKYNIIEEIGRGGMAVVYKALQTDLKREVALKVMPANITLNYRFVERFLSEGQSVAKLSHPNIVNIYEMSSENGVYYIAMEYITGTNLYQHLNENKPKLVDVLEIVSKLADALAYAHSQKIIHRDLKLNNVIMKDPLTPVLIDFGLAKALEESDSGGGITRTGEIMGSPAYMAPERLMGKEVDHRSDICSLGIMLYEMLTFKNPYLDQRNLHQTTFNVMEANPIPPKKLIPWLPVEIEAITLKAMAKDPAARYQTMEELRKDIIRYQNGEPVMARPPSLKKRTASYMRKRWAPIAITLLVLIFSGIIGGSYYIQRKRVYSYWQLFYAQSLSTSSGEWTLVNSDSLLQGKLEDGTRSFTISSPGFSFMRLEQHFNRDVMIEFDISAPSKNLHRAGLFLFGDSPENAHCVHINRDGFGESGITYPGSQFLFSDAERGTIPWQDVNQISVERQQNSISLTINGMPVARVYDFFPAIGKHNEKIGFFVKGSEATISNVRVYRRAIPQIPSPTLIGDRFRERGDFESAIDEYNGLMIDQSALNLTKDLHLNIADCMIRLGKYEDAINILDKSAQLHSSDALKAKARYLSGLSYLFMGDTVRAEGAFAVVTRYYKQSTVGFSIMAAEIARCAKLVNAGETDWALRDIVSNATLYPKATPHWGALHLSILEKMAREGAVDGASRVSNSINALYGDYPEIKARAKIAVADAYLNAGQTATASDMYNQSINQSASDNVWRSWYAIADLYEYNFDYEHAQKIYNKILKEAPPASVMHWMAKIKCAEQSVRDTATLATAQLLHETVDGPHPFLMPRIIAAYYTDRITEIEFLSIWDNLLPQDSWGLYYVARKLLLQGNRAEAISVITVLQRQLPVSSWQTFQVQKILYAPDKWN